MDDGLKREVLDKSVVSKDDCAVRIWYQNHQFQEGRRVFGVGLVLNTISTRQNVGRFSFLDDEVLFCRTTYCVENRAAAQMLDGIRLTHYQVRLQ